MQSPDDKSSFLFRFVQPEIRVNLKFDDEALFSTTDQLTADKITRDILRFLPASSTITDCTACIGGNTFSFSQQFASVRAYEIDPMRAEYLRMNMGALSVNNVEIQCGDALELISQTGDLHDLVFIDPPWGGPNYKEADRVRLSLSGRTLEEACIAIAPYCRYIALKVPTNFDETGFLDGTHGYLELKHKNAQLRKMHLLIFRVVPTTFQPRSPPSPT